jgi:hypothetical protein
VKLLDFGLAKAASNAVCAFPALDPAGVSRFEVHVLRDGQAYVYTLDRILTNLFVVEGPQ